MHKLFIPIISIFLILSNDSFLKKESVDNYNFKETLSFDEIAYDKVESIQIEYSFENITQKLTFKEDGFKEYIDSLKGITYYLDKTNELDMNIYGYDFDKNICEFHTNLYPISLIINYDGEIHRITFGCIPGYTMDHYGDLSLDEGEKVYFIYKYEIETNNKTYSATYYSEYEAIYSSFVSLILDRNNMPYIEKDYGSRRYYLRPIKYENNDFIIESRKIDFNKDQDYIKSGAFYPDKNNKFDHRAWGLKMYDRNNKEISELPYGDDYVYLYDLNNNQYQLHFCNYR